MRFKNYIKEAFTDWSKLKSDIDQSVASIQKALEKIREQRKKNVEEIERLRAEKKREKDAKKQEKINQKINKLKQDNEKIGEQEDKLVKAKQDAETKDSQDKSDSNDEKDSGEKSTDNDFEKEDEKTIDKDSDAPVNPELPDVEDVSLKKMSKSDIRKLIDYYEKQNEYLEYKRIRTKGKESFAIANKMSTIQDEIKDLSAELNRRK